jgi:hypothetical protein
MFTVWGRLRSDCENRSLYEWNTDYCKNDQWRNDQWKSGRWKNNKWKNDDCTRYETMDA